ncbi:MAG: single-stranded-DNA-specific exonuclease RecJ [Clostridiales bacterium]|nr:single-stranded-DNA-specific exonuclease RecJ [Clostridiales bacterium]
MILLEKKWRLPDEKKIAESEGAQSLLDGILKARGIDSESEKATFLKSLPEDFYDPFLMNDMDVAVDRLIAAVSGREKILICGDYDADGVTATAILTLFLRRLGANVDHVIPSRLVEGYGVSGALTDRIRARKPDLVVTVDCGVSNAAEIGELMEEGPDVVVTDHHEVKEVLPPALAVIDCKRPDNRYPFVHLCGAAVALKLVQACCIRLNSADSPAGSLSVAPDDWKNYIDIAALGTIADVVPMIGENRALVREGIGLLNNTGRVGLRALFDIVRPSANAPVRLNSTDIAFQIVPKINACGRMGDAVRALDLILTEDEKEAKNLAQELVTENSRRQLLEQKILEEAVEKIESNHQLIEGLRNPSMPIVVAGENWHVGILGIVASRLVSRYQRTAIVFTRIDDMLKGSCRTAGDYPILDCLKACGDSVAQYGGHKRAAGVSVEVARYGEFLGRIGEWAQSRNSEADIAEIDVDCTVRPERITVPAVEELSALEPYGEGNREPVFHLQGLRITQTQLVGAEKQHLKLTVAYKKNDNGKEKTETLDAIAFRAAEMADMFVPGSMVDMLVAPGINVWNGNKQVSLRVQDMHFMPIGRTIWDQPQLLENLYRNRIGIDKVALIGKCRVQDLCPTGPEMGILYQFLRDNCSEATNIVDLSYLARLVTGRYKKPLHAFKISRAMDIFCEAGLVQMQRINDDRCCFSLISVKDKVKLEDTETYQILRPHMGDVPGGQG